MRGRGWGRDTGEERGMFIVYLAQGRHLESTQLLKSFRDLVMGHPGQDHHSP